MRLYDHMLSVIVSHFDPYLKPNSPVVMTQRWRDLLFLHWEISPELIQRRLPQGLSVDTHKNKAYLGIVPFFMDKVRPRFCPPVPGLSWFLELNVRTYVRDSTGRPGVWFLSLDCNQSLAVELARKLFNLPYQHAAMKTEERDELISYECRRKSEPEWSRWSYGSDGPEQIAEEGSLEFFLLERYLLFSQSQNGDLYWGQVHHPPYRFSEARVEKYDILPATWNDIELTGPSCSALFSHGPEVNIHPLKKLTL